MTTVTKKDLVHRLSERFDLKKSVVKELVQTFLDEIVAELGKGHRLEFREFGVFEIKLRAARVARNPKTGETVTVPGRAAVQFRPGRELKERVAASGPGGHQSRTEPGRQRRAARGGDLGQAAETQA